MNCVMTLPEPLANEVPRPVIGRTMLPGLPAGPVNNAMSEAGGGEVALFEAVALMPGWVTPDVPPKSTVPSKAVSESLKLANGTVTTMTDRSGRVSVSVAWNWSWTTVGDVSVLSTAALPWMLPVNMKLICCSVPRPVSNFGIETEDDQFVFVSGIEPVKQTCW